MFLGTLTMLNILGVTRFLDMSFTVFSVEVPFVVAVGVLPYPVTFLCTDFISELYGRKRASLVVLIGLLLNLWVIFILWLGGILPPVPPVDLMTGLPSMDQPDWAFWKVRKLTFGAVAASMVAYMAAQLCDVFLFHFWKRLTKGKHLWLRNNGSTLISQMIDTFAVITITHFYASGLAGVIDKNEPIWSELWKLIFAGYVFKFIVALIDTIPFYIGTHYLSQYLRIGRYREFEADAEEVRLFTSSDG